MEVTILTWGIAIAGLLLIGLLSALQLSDALLVGISMCLRARGRAADHFRANQKLGSNETPFSGPRKAFTIRPHDDRSPGVSEPIARSA